MPAPSRKRKATTTEVDSRIAVLEAQNIVLQEEKKLAEERCMRVVMKGAEDKSKLTTENEFLAEQLHSVTQDLYFEKSASEVHLRGNLKLMDQVKIMRKSLKKFMDEEM